MLVVVLYFSFAVAAFCRFCLLRPHERTSRFHQVGTRREVVVVVVDYRNLDSLDPLHYYYYYSLKQ